MTVHSAFFWNDWRDYCEEMSLYDDDTELLVSELMASQAEHPCLPPESVRAEAWQYAAELWRVGVSPEDLELLAQLGHVGSLIGHDCTVDAIDSGDSTYYYTDCNTIAFDDVDPAEGDQRVRDLTRSYWQDGPYKEICAGLLQTLRDKLGLAYVPAEASLYALFEAPMILASTDSYKAADFSKIVFKRGERTWSTRWGKRLRSTRADCTPRGDWAKELGWSA